MNVVHIDESILLKLIRKQNHQRGKKFFPILKSGLIFLFLLGIGFFLYNFSGIIEKADYFFNYQILMKPQSQKRVVARYFLPEIQKIQKLSTTLLEVEDSLLIIPRINQRLPIIWDSPAEGKKMFSNLRRGVIHLENTSKPDEIGNVVIAGHSSSPIWDKNPYGKAFSNLDKLKIGDLIELHFNRKAYFYEVKKVFITSKTDLSVLNKTEKPSLTLITCTPIGTAEKRLIVRAGLLNSNLATKKQTELPSLKFLPKTR